MGQQLQAILGQTQQGMGEMGQPMGMGQGVDPKMLLAQLAAQLAEPVPGGYGPSGMVQRTLQSSRPVLPAVQPMQMQPMGQMAGPMPMMGMQDDPMPLGLGGLQGPGGY